MKIGIVGAGALGGYAAARWVEAGRDVILLARGHNGAHIEEHGVAIVSPLGDVHVDVSVSDDPTAFSDADVVMFATMSWQLGEAVERVGPHLRSDVVVFGVQNGVGSVFELQRIMGSDAVMGGTCRIICYRERPGVIRHVGVEPTILFGEVEGGMSDRAREVEFALDVHPHLRVVASPEIRVELWRKYLLFAPVSAVGSVTRLAIGAFRSDPEGRAMLEAGVHEVAAVAEALGVDLGSEAENWALSFIDKLPADGTSSMHRDFEAGRRTEVDVLAEGVVRVGRELGIPTPMFDSVLEALMPLELAARG